MFERMRVLERKEEGPLQADLPGMTAKDVELAMQGGNLTIRRRAQGGRKRKRKIEVKAG
jgi:HSP20 family molecular chaperone IbpA